MINKHGLKINGLKKVSGETLPHYNSGCYDEIFYDKATGDLWTVYQCDFAGNTWTEYHDPNIIKVCNATSHYTMQELADAVFAEIQYAE